MKHRSEFTMIELLVVVGIIALLTGLVTPAVISAQRQGRITQAKSDMQSILMALKGVEGAYGRMVTVASSKVTFNGEDAASTTSTTCGSSGKTKTYNYAVIGDTDAYDAMIAEFSDPGNSDLSTLNVNKRKKVFLDPKSGYDPSQAYNSTDNKKQLWLDPWGNRYRVYINTDCSIGIPNPATVGESSASDRKVLAVKAAVVSCGPNGEWNDAKNIDFPNEGSPTGDADDIASWRN